MNILVTGANGFIGRRLSQRLETLGHQLCALRQDISKPFTLEGHFDIAIHLAAYNITNLGDKNEDLYTAVNVAGTRHLIDAVKANKFIYMSTAKVYKNEGLPLSEESPLGPQGAYAESKLKAEDILRASLPQESLVILRSVNVIGWGQAPKAVLPVFFGKAKANEAMDIIYASDTPMQFVYVEDLTDAIETVINNAEAYGIFNLAYEKPVTLEQLARQIISITKSLSALNTHKNASLAVFSPVVCEKIYQHLGWKAKTDLPEILKTYAQEYAKLS